MGRILVYGHRGYPYRYPENTIASFLAALLYGADGIELDVWLTRDGEPVVIHDRRTGRVAGIDVDVKEKTMKELSSISLGMGQTIPSLRDVLEALPPAARLIVELKEPDAALPALELVKEHGHLQETLFTSFIPEAVARIREAEPNAAIGLNIGDLKQAEEALRLLPSLRPTTIVLPVVAPIVVGWQVFTNYVEQVKRRGLRLYVWSPIGSKPAELEELYKKLRDYIDGAIMNDLEKEPLFIREETG